MCNDSCRTLEQGTGHQEPIPWAWIHRFSGRSSECSDCRQSQGKAGGTGDNGFRWLGHYDISIDDLLSGVSREKKSDLAEKLIRDCLSDGRYPQQALMDKAKRMDISKRIIDEVKKRLNVRSVKDGNQWFWQLPDELPL